MQQMQRINTAPNVEIETIVAGAHHAAALVFIPGLGTTYAQFERDVAHFSDRYHTAAMSLRGHGGAPYPPQPSAADFTLATLARDVLALMDHLGMDAAHIVGNSAGGVVGCELIAQAPERVRSLVTFGTTPKLQIGAAGHVVVLVDRILGPKLSAWLAQRTVSKQPGVGVQLAQMIASTPKPVIVNVRRNLLNYDYTSTIAANPSVPVTIVRGANDNEVNRLLDPLLDALAATPHVTVEPLAAAGHVANLDQPEPFWALLTAHLARIE